MKNWPRQFRMPPLIYKSHIKMGRLIISISIMVTVVIITNIIIYSNIIFFINISINVTAMLNWQDWQDWRALSLVFLTG